jgi:hypothetical protein
LLMQHFWILISVTVLITYHMVFEPTPKHAAYIPKPQLSKMKQALRRCFGGDCIHCDDGYVGPNCTLYFPNCSVPYPEWIGNGLCDGDVYYTEACGWDLHSVVLYLLSQTPLPIYSGEGTEQLG